MEDCKICLTFTKRTYSTGILSPRYYPSTFNVFSLFSCSCTSSSSSSLWQQCFAGTLSRLQQRWLTLFSHQYFLWNSHMPTILWNIIKPTIHAIDVWKKSQADDYVQKRTLLWKYQEANNSLNLRSNSHKASILS